MTGQPEDPFGKKRVRNPTKSSIFVEISLSPLFSPNHFLFISWGSLQVLGEIGKSGFCKPSFRPKPHFAPVREAQIFEILEGAPTENPLHIGVLPGLQI